MDRTQLFQPSFRNQTLRCGITCAATANYRPRLRQNGTSSSQKSPSRCRFDAFFTAGRVFPVVFRRYPRVMPSRVSSTVPSGSGGQSSGLRAMVSAGSADTKKSRGHYPTGFFREDLAGVVGFEPTNGGFRIRCLNRTWRYPSTWCGRRDSNSHASRHSHLKAARLPISPRPHTAYSDCLHS